MKLHKTDRQIDTSGISEKGSFGIDREDMSFIARLLRDDMYSDKMLAVVREYSTNAVDAHQKRGIGEVPIRIKVPTAMEPVLKIRDFGAGIPKEEIFDRYVKYGKSDKRDSDLNGYFGIGCKAGFAYGDSFIVRTFHDGTESVFSAQIGEDQLGGIFLLSEQDTTETGLEIEIDVQVRDVEAFQSRIKEVCTFLEVTPILSKELEFEPYNKGKELLEGVYEIPEGDREHVGSYYNGGYITYAVMGGVRYPIDQDLAYEGIQYTDELTNQCKTLLQKGLYIEFDMSDFPLVMHPSRERLVYERTTKLNLKGRFKEVIEELGKSEEAEFDKATTALEAWNVYEYSIFMAKTAWKNISFKRLMPKVDMVQDSRRYYTDPLQKDTIKTKKFNSSTSNNYYGERTFAIRDLLGDGDNKNAVILEKGDGQMLPRVRTLLDEGFKNVYVTGVDGLTEQNVTLKEYFPSRILHSDDVEQTKLKSTYVTKSDGTKKVVRSTVRHHQLDKSRRNFIMQRWENSKDETMWNSANIWVAVAEDDLPAKDKIYMVTSRNRPVDYSSFEVNNVMGALCLINNDYEIFSVKKADEGSLDETWIEARAYIQKHKSELQRVLTLQKQINKKILISLASKRTLLFGNYDNANDIGTLYHGTGDKYEYNENNNDQYAKLIDFDLKGVVDKQAEDWMGKRKVLLDTYPVLKYIDWKAYEKQETYAEMKKAILASN